MTEIEAEALESQLRSLKEMRDSRGWSLLKDAIKDDILNACLQMADNPVMSEKEIDFRRGAISAARNFVNALDLMIARLEGELLVASAERQTLINPNAKA